MSVGEHLRGERFFNWRGYEIAISAPGVHHASVESFTDTIITDEDTDYAELDQSKLADIAYLGRELSREVWQRRKVPIRRGMPTTQFLESPLDRDADEQTGEEK